MNSSSTPTPPPQSLISNITEIARATKPRSLITWERNAQIPLAPFECTHSQSLHNNHWPPEIQSCPASWTSTDRRESTETVITCLSDVYHWWVCGQWTTTQDRLLSIDLPRDSLDWNRTPRKTPLLTESPLNRNWLGELFQLLQSMLKHTWL